MNTELLIINPKHELLRWGPIPMYMFYMSEFLMSIFGDVYEKYPKGYWPHSILLTRNGQFLWLNDFPEVRKGGAEYFLEYVVPIQRRQQLIDVFRTEARQTLRRAAEIANMDLASLSDDAFVEVWNSYYQEQISAWTPTVPLELGNYASDALLKNKLRSYVDASELDAAMEVLTAPEALSFYQEEEIDLAETNDLEAHQRAYFWLKNSYAGVQILQSQFFEERKREIPRDIRARMNKHVAETREKKVICIDRYRIPASIVAIADALRAAMEFQDERKKWILMCLHTKYLLVSEAARRLGVDLSSLLYYEYMEIPDLLRGHALVEDRASGRYLGFIVGPDHSVRIIRRTLDATEMQEIWDIYTAEKFDTGLTEFRGTTASTGDGTPVCARVRVLLDPSHEFTEGDILVTTMTSPEYVFAMKKSSAIITDTGGLTSHAAIVSRELKKPCIIGTKIATKVLRDGDEVEVDATKGIVKILRRK